MINPRVLGVTAGVTATSPPGGRRLGRRGRNAVVASLVAAGLVASATVTAGVANAAVPTFPDNLVVFPDRDFITVEGYQNHTGETATVEVSRGGTVVGSAQGVVSGGAVAFEINHPGGSCWGDGTNLKVTPDIKPGDVATIKFEDPNAPGSLYAGGDTNVQDAYVTGVNYAAGARTFTVVGHIATGVNRDNVEQRIVNPDLTGTNVARRDVRAVPGPMTPAPKGGYSSSLVFSGETFTATYEFDDADTARIAATGGGERALTWQLADAAGNRQGITIAEFGEKGGPGMGGCPLGPSDQPAPQGTFTSVLAANKQSVQVNWTPAAAQPGAAAVTGYSVEAIATKTSTAPGQPGQRVQVGVRTLADATKTTISGLDPADTYSIEVRSLAGPRMSEAFPQADAAPVTPPGQGAPADTTKPIITAAQAANGDVTLGSSEPNTDIYYTTDGTSPLDTNANLPAQNATLYTGPIKVAQGTTLTLRWVGFDRAGNVSAVGAKDFASVAPPAATAPGIPPGVTARPGTDPSSVNVGWTAPADGGSPITKYTVRAYESGAMIPVKTTDVTPATPDVLPPTSAVLTGLRPGAPYQVTVTATNGSGNTARTSGESARVAVTPGDVIGITSARWKRGDFRVVGTGSVTGAVVTVYKVNPDGTIGAPLTIGNGRNAPNVTATVTAPVAPATVGDFTIRVRAGAPTSNPGRIYVKSDKGGVTGPFTVANG